MKKTFAIILVIALVSMMSISAMAATINTADGTASHDVNATYVAPTGGADVYAVDVAWGSMEFTYTAADSGVWNTETHKFDDVVAAAWSFAADANKVTVTNHSSQAVDVAVTYAQTVGTVTGTITGGEFTLAKPDENGAGTTNSATLALTGSVTENGKVGTITVTLS